MTNSRAVNSEDINTFGLIKHLPLNATPKCLYFDLASSNAPKSMHDLETNADYKTSSGIYFYVCQVAIQEVSVTSGTMTISSSGTTDTLGTIKITIPLKNWVTTIEQQWIIPFEVLISSNKYCVIDSTTTSVRFVTIYGYEIPKP